MTIKEKFSSIDQSKLTAEQKSFLSKIKNVTKDFSIKDKDVNDKVEGALDKMIATLKEKMPEAIKSTTAPKTPRKRSVMSVAKEIKKPEESFEEAKKRATKKIADDKESVKETIKSELDKLNEFIKKKKTLQDIKGTDLLIDSKRKAKPVGRRLSKTGRVYYEYRDSKTDRLSPNYPKNAPYLAGGGGVEEKEFSLAQAISYIKDAKKDRMSFYYNVYGGNVYFTLQPTFATPTGKLKGFPRMVTITKEGKITGKNLTYELGGSVVTDLAGHTGGSLGTGNKGMLDGFSNTAYTGLVGETGAMSSGEMFMNGGGLPDGAEQSYVNYYLGEGASQGIYKDGGTIIESICWKNTRKCLGYVINNSKISFFT